MLSQAVGSELWLRPARAVDLQSLATWVAQTPRESCLAHPTWARKHQKIVAMDRLVELALEDLHRWIRLLWLQANSQQAAGTLLRLLYSLFLQVRFVELQLPDVSARACALHEKGFRHIGLQFFILYKVKNPIRLNQKSFEGYLGRLAEHRSGFVADAAVEKPCP